MPRRRRIHIVGGFYHVTLRGNHRQDIFFSPEDRTDLNEIVAEVITRYRTRVHAYCWMTNHVHLLLQVGEMPLGRSMLRIASRYARNVQARFRTTGHLFERRYHSLLVDADEYLLELLRYIHLNPVRAGMVKSVDDYPWSSHHAYLEPAKQPWVTTDVALSMFHSDRSKALAAYHRFVGESTAGMSASPSSQSNPNDPRIIGSDQFVGTIPGASWRPRSRKTLDEVIEGACKEFGVTLEELQSPSCRRALTRVRAWIAHRAISLKIASMSNIARTLHRSESSLRECVERHFSSTNPRSRDPVR